MVSVLDFELVAQARTLREMWEQKTGDYLGPAWDGAFADWLRRWGSGLVADAVQLVVASRYSEDGERFAADVRDVPKYAAVEYAEECKPGIRECYLVRGRMRKKFFCDDQDEAVLNLLRVLMEAGVMPAEMNRAVDECLTLEDAFAMLGVDRVEFRIAMGHPIMDVPLRDRVFIREEEDEWRLWDRYLRETTGKGAPINRNFGWFFPSRLPPIVHPKKVRSVQQTYEG